ncbi:hypothetical protein AGDE_16481 [Angomonas deanei]|uniref:Uncharacterized protein n=1 Tax=Angomonas deanei TaxID=59799 RepID=A0A7G2CHM9_9TRYP|nr:hypothetical protein AGDE_16481 [Angomonas deanei]CAD2218193.1 hypothetical protein, conserved [Angomonas deanei]|eukprot:EPY17014.1 hypothetical protein AGDE_16481 [Angomonas deanei]
MNAASHLKQRKDPVRSATGSYLRSPFHINHSFSALAEKHVLSHSRPQAGKVSEGEVEGSVRPWGRSGVGAGSMTGKEKTQQLELVQKIYGPSTHDDDDDNTNTNTASGEKALHRHTTSEGKQKHAGREAVVSRGQDAREKEIMKKLAPRDNRRHRGDSSHSHLHENEEEDQGKEQHVKVKSKTKPHHHDTTNTNNSSPAEEAEDAPPAHKRPREEEEEDRIARLQRLEAERAALLYRGGKKNKKKRIL